MATTTTFYNSYKKNCLDGAINLASDTIKVALTSSSYTPNIDSHAFFSDITNEVSASGTYVAGGVALGTKTTTQDNTNNKGVFDSADYSLTGTTTTARYAIIYKDTGSAATSPLIAYVDFGENKSSSAGTFGITWNAEGIINVN